MNLALILCGLGYCKLPKVKSLDDRAQCPRCHARYIPVAIYEDIAPPGGDREVWKPTGTYTWIRLSG